MNSNPAYILSLLAEHGYDTTAKYADLVRSFLDHEFDWVLAAYSSINSRLCDDAGALIYRFKAHAEHELEGGHIIEAIGRSAPEPFLTAMVRHGEDEKRHHRMFSAMTQLVAKEVGFAPIEFASRDPQRVIDNFSRPSGWKLLICTIHWAEVRNIFILNNYLNSLSNCRWTFAKTLIAQLRAVLADEVRHVGYTAQALEKVTTEDPDLSEYALSYKESYLASCWEDVGEMSNYFSTHERLAA